MKGNFRTKQSRRTPLHVKLRLRADCRRMLRVVQTFRWLLAAGVGALLVVGFPSCGGSSTQATIPATGGELCTPDRRLCLEIPAQAIAETQTFRIFFPSTDRPGGQLSEVWDIEAVDRDQLRFLKPATIRVRLDAVDMTQVRDDTLLRVFTSRDGNWEVLGNLFFDRVRNELRGTTSLLSTSGLKRAVSAFTVLRVDRLPDGGVPMETDAGPLPDSGVIIIPPVPDAGRRDAGVGGGSAGGGAAGGGAAGGGAAAGGRAGGSAAGGSAAGGSAAGGSPAGGSAAGGSAAGGSAAGGSAAGGSAAGGSAAGGSAAGGSAAGGSAAGGSAAGGSAAGGSAAGGSAAGGTAAGGTAAGGSAAGGSAAGGSAAGGSAAGGSAAGGSAAGGSAAGGSAGGGSAAGSDAGASDGGADGG